MQDVAVKRDSFGSKWGFILSCVGSAVGMGNIWMFPTRVSKYGGGTFLLPYFICVVVIGLTGVVGEMSFGRAMRSGPIGAFGKAMEQRTGNGGLGRLIGFIPMLGSLALAIGYSVVIGWIFRYTFSALSGSILNPASIDEYGAQFGGMATAFGNNTWQIIGLVISFAIMVFGIASGIEKVNKVMMPLFFAFFIGLAIYMAFQPGASDGYKYIFNINPSGLADPMVWVFALGQAFFSLSLAGNGTVIYGSYLGDDVNVVSSAVSVAIFDTMAALLAALVIIPAMATTGAQLDSGGPGLMFIFLPNLFKGMPGSRILVIVFFLAVLFAGVSSIINLFEAPIAAVEELFRLKRWQAVAIIGVLGTVVGVSIQGIVGNWMDFVSIYLCPLGAALAGIMFFWMCKKEFIEKEINKGREGLKPFGAGLITVGKFVFCGLTILVFILGIVIKGGIG